jgi:hypothetical protein
MQPETMNGPGASRGGTLSHVAEMLGEYEEWLFEVAEEMDTEDGQLWVVGVGALSSHR